MDRDRERQKQKYTTTNTDSYSDGRVITKCYKFRNKRKDIDGKTLAQIDRCKERQKD
jgi:hypothetical protein